MPEYAESIAYSEACRNQGFKIGRSLGLQFHLETTAESLNSLLENCAEELETALSAKAKYVQSKSQILETAKTALPELNAAMTELLDAMLA